MIEIRPLRKNDNHNDLVLLSMQFFEEYLSHHEDFFKIDRLDEVDILNYFSHFIDSSSGKVLIALTEGKIVGYITIYVKEQANFWEVKKIGHISGLMVDKAYRRKGIARRLLEQAKSFFKEMGVRYYTVFTAAENLGAVEFYEQNGLSPIYRTMLGDLGRFTEE